MGSLGVWLTYGAGEKLGPDAWAGTALAFALSSTFWNSGNFAVHPEFRMVRSEVEPRSCQTSVPSTAAYRLVLAGRPDAWPARKADRASGRSRCRLAPSRERLVPR